MADKLRSILADIDAARVERTCLGMSAEQLAVVAVDGRDDGFLELVELCPIFSFPDGFMRSRRGELAVTALPHEDLVSICSDIATWFTEKGLDARGFDAVADEKAGAEMLVVLVHGGRAHLRRLAVASHATKGGIA